MWTCITALLMEQILLLFYHVMYISDLFLLLGLLHFTYLDRAEETSLSIKVNSKLNSVKLT